MHATIRHGNSTGMWLDLIREGEKRRHLALGEDLEAYLCFALMRHMGDAAMTGRVMALEWLDAHERPTSPDRLRDVGDRCLLIAGLFPKLARRRRVDTDYYVDLGRGAYATAADRAPRCERGLFGNLAEAFLSLVDVLRAVRPDAQMQPLPIPCRSATLGRRLN